jgi:diadenosine tetraphosphate (Ap4A) HIT family hydrolase
VPENAAPLPDFTRWPSFPFEGDMRVKDLAPPVAVEPPRSGEDASECVACNTPDDAYIWENERWRVRAMDRPTGLPMVLILECRSHLDMGDLPNLLAAELGVMTVRLERAIRSLDGVARVHVNRWGDGSAHLHMWFLARPYGRLQLRGTFLSLWDDILPTIPEDQWRENLALVAAWLAEFGGHANAEPAHIQWQSPSTFSVAPLATGPGTEYASASSAEPAAATPADSDAAEPDSAPITDSNRGPGAAPVSANADSDPVVAGSGNLGNTDSDPTGRAGTVSASADSDPVVGASTNLGNTDSDPAGSAGSVSANTDSDAALGASANAEKTDSDPGRSAGTVSANTESDPAVDTSTASEDTDSKGSLGADSMTGSGSDHGSSSAGESAAVAGASRTETDSEAIDSPAKARLTSAAPDDANAESGHMGERPYGDGDSASVWVADAEKGLWRPSDLGEAERPAPKAGEKADPSSAAEATTEPTEDRQAVLHGPDADAGVVSGDQNEAGSDTSPDRSAFIPNPDTEVRGASSAAGRNDRGAADAADDQTDESAETAGTRRS